MNNHQNEEKSLNAGEMEDFAKLFEESENRLEASSGGIILGRVVAKEGEFFLIDVGRKSESKLMASEMPKGVEVASGTILPVVSGARKPGETGYFLSVRKAVRRIQWESLQDHFKNGDLLEGHVLRIRGDSLFIGLRVGPQGEAREKFNQVPGRLWELSIYPAEMMLKEIDIEDPRPLKHWIGRPVTVKILEMSSDGMVLVSRRKVVEQTIDQIRLQKFSQTKAGDVIKAKVKKITESLIYLESSYMECRMVPVETSWYPNPAVSRQFRIGDLIDVKVLGIDKESQKLMVSRRALLSHPADELTKHFAPGMVVECEIRRVLPRGGYFVRIAGLKRDAYIPGKETFSDLELKEGAKIKATITKIDRDNIRVILSQKRYEKSQDSNLMAKYSQEGQPYSLGQILQSVDQDKSEDEPPPQD